MSTTTEHTKPFLKTELPNDWEVKSLGNLGVFSKGKGILKDQVLKKGFPCVRYGEIYTTYDFVIDRFKSFINQEVANQSKEIKKGDILFAGSGETIEEIGKAVGYINDEKAFAGGDIIILSPNKEIDTTCLSYALETDFVKRQKRVLGQGNSVVHIYASDLSKVKIPLPPLPEQKAIAEILSAWDAFIQKTQALIDAKEKRKKSLMQQLLTGKLRLRSASGERFSGEWKSRKLGDIGKIRMCKRIFNHETSEKGDIPFYKIGTFGKKPDAFISKEIFETYRSKFQFPRKGDILISAAGTIGRTVVYDGKPSYFQDSNIVWIENNETLVKNKYLFYVLQIVMYNTQGGTIQRLYNSIISTTKFVCPPLDEQTAIAEVLQTADKEIELLKAKRDKLKEQKKGLMQVLLTGKVRVSQFKSEVKL